MAKTAVNEIISRVKGRADYSIADNDLTTLLLEIISDQTKIVKQWLLDSGIFKDISAQTTLSTVASQAYVDLSTVTDLDEIIRVSERTNDNTIEMLPYRVFLDYYPDPTANTASTPIHGSLLNGRLYLGPTPSGIITLYLDYVKLISDAASGGTMPFESKYDPLIIKMAKKEFLDYIDPKDNTTLMRIQAEIEDLKDTLIVSAAKNIDMTEQSQSRRSESDFVGPRKPS